MDKKKLNIISWSLFYALLFLALLQNSLASLDPDLGWHLKIGQEIMKNQAVPRVDAHLDSIPSLHWVDHEWLANLLLWLAFNHFGYIILNIIFALIVVSAFFLLNSYSNKIILGPPAFWLIASLEILAFFGAKGFWGVRLQTLTFLFLIIAISLLDNFSRSPNKKIWLTVPLLFFLWANLHGSFMIGLAVVWGFAAYHFLQPLFIRLGFEKFFDLSPRLSSKHKSFLAASALLAALSAFFTPYGLEYFSFMASYADTHYLSNIAEWLPVWRYPTTIWWLIYPSIISTVLILSFINKKRKPELWRFVLTLLLLLLAFKSRRNFPLFFAVSLPLAVRFFDQFQSSRKASNQKLIGIFIGVAALAGGAYLILQTNFTNQAFSNPRFCRNYPCAIVEKIKNNPDLAEKKMFNDYVWGGFLMQVWPEKKLFVDGRFPQMPVKGHSFLAEYQEFFDQEKLPNKLAEYGIEMVLMRRRPPIKVNWTGRYLFGFNENKLKDNPNHLKEYLETSPEWEKIIESVSGDVYAKK